MHSVALNFQGAALGLVVAARQFGAAFLLEQFVIRAVEGLLLLQNIENKLHVNAVGILGKVLF